MPVAHSLLDALREIEGVADLDGKQLWARPAGAASVGFHLRHIVGAMDRLLTYARGQSLREEQFEYLRSEAGPVDRTAEELVGEVRRAVDAAVDQLRATPAESQLEPRSVGRAQLPSTVQGLLFHAAEHTRRHTGQIIVTAKVVGATAP
ncbi:MAG: DinB family protein [Gemmatimonadetes bacterium]|nr:DinB family protein [Gemmatimonadota bacterium]